MYRYIRYTIYDVFVYRIHNSGTDLHFFKNLLQTFFDCIFSEPHSHDLLRKLQSNLQISTEIVSLCENLWAYRYKATKAVYENYDEILETLDIIYESKSSQKMTA